MHNVLFIRFLLLPIAFVSSLLVALLSNDYIVYYAARWFLILCAPLLLCAQSLSLILSSIVFFIPGLLYNYSFYSAHDPGLVAGPFLYMYSSVILFHFLGKYKNIFSRISLRPYLSLLVYFLLTSNLVFFLLDRVGIFIIDYETRGITSDRFSINNPLEFYFIILGLILSIQRLGSGVEHFLNFFTLISVALSKSRVFILLMSLKTILDTKSKVSKVLLIIFVLFGIVYLSVGDERFQLSSIADDPSLVIRMLKLDEFVDYDFSFMDRIFGLGSNSYKIITNKNVSLEFLFIDILFSFGIWPVACFLGLIFCYRYSINFYHLSIVEALFIIYGFIMIPISYATPVLFFVIGIICFDIKDKPLGRIRMDHIYNKI